MIERSIYWLKEYPKLMVEMKKPSIIEKGKIEIAGVCGDGSETTKLWKKFCKRGAEFGVENKNSDHGYEVRSYSGGNCKCFVGFSVSDLEGNEEFDRLTLPPSEYAVFEIHVAEGYDSQNEAMDEWIDNNEHGYVQSKYEGKPFVIEYYDERYKGDEPGSIVEIWVPIEKK